MAETIGERLGRAIELQIGSVRMFQTRLQKKKPGLKGTSRTTIYAYLNSEKDPGLGFIQAAADVLGVREEWLANNDGPMTVEEEIRQAAVTLEGEPGDLFIGPDWMMDDIEMEFPGVRDSDFSGRRTLQEFVLDLVTWQWAERDGLPPEHRVQGIDIDEVHRPFARLVGRALRGPLDQLGIDPAELNPWQRTRYMLAMENALTSLIYQAPHYLGKKKED